VQRKYELSGRTELHGQVAMMKKNKNRGEEGVKLMKVEEGGVTSLP